MVILLRHHMGARIELCKLPGFEGAADSHQLRVFDSYCTVNCFDCVNFQGSVKALFA